jgi:hypothetical protein
LDDAKFVSQPEAVMSDPKHRRLRLLSLISLASTAVLLSVGLSSPVAAASDSPQYCGPRKALIKELSQRYHEVQVAIGVSNNGSLVEVLTSKDGLTWSIMISKPNGASCLVSVGEGWETLRHASSGERGA